MSKPPTAIEKLLSALEELGGESGAEESLVSQIEAIDAQIASAVAPLKKKRAALQRCRMILRGKRLVREGKLGCRKKKDATAPLSSPATTLHPGSGGLLQDVLAALSGGPKTVPTIAASAGIGTDKALDILQILKKAGRVKSEGAGLWVRVAG